MGSWAGGCCRFKVSPTSESAVIKVVALPPVQELADDTPTSVPIATQPVPAQSVTVDPSPPAAAPTAVTSPVPVSSPDPVPAAPQSFTDTPPPDNSTEPVASPTSAPVTPPDLPSPPSGPGLQLFWSVTSPAQLQLPVDRLTGFLSVQDSCVFSQDWSQGSVTVGVQITVEADGGLSQAMQPLGSRDNPTYSDSPAYQEALICLSQKLFLPDLETALANQFPSTREVQLEVTASPRL